MKKIFFLLLFIASALSVWAQKINVDSLRNIAAHTNSDLVKLNIYFELDGYFEERRPDSSILYAKKEIEWGKRHKNDEIVNSAVMGEGYAYYNEGNFPLALKCELEALKYFETQPDKRSLPGIYNLIGNVYKGQQNYPKALYYYQHCKTLAIALNTKGSEKNAVMNMGYVYDQLNLLDSAVYYTNECLREGKILNETYGIDYNYYVLGDVYFKLKNYKKALYYFHNSFMLAEKIYEPKIISIGAFGLSSYYTRIGNIDSAMYYGHIAYTAARNGTYTLFLYKSASLLATLYENSSQTDSAYKYLKLSVSANDSLFNSQKSQAVENLTTDEFLRQDAILAAEHEYNNKLRFYGLIAVLVIFLAIAFLLWRNNANQKKAYLLLNEQKTQTDIQKNTAENALIQLKQTQTQLIQSEKMASLGELTAGIAHEIQNPLNFVNNFSEVSVELLGELKEEIKAGHTSDVIAIADDLTQNLEKIKHHGKRADFIVKGMLQHSRTSTGEKQLTDINILADEFFKLSYHGLRAKDKNFNAELTTNFDKRLPKVNIAQQDIGRVLLNLFNNAFYAVNQKHKVARDEYKPEVTVSTSIEKNNLVIKVKDNGNGIPDAVKDKIMQPFFTTKPTGEGTGLGLSLSYDIVVKGHGGKIDINTKEGEFTEFIVTLPA